MKRASFIRIIIVLAAGLAIAADAVRAQIGRGAEHQAIAYSKSTPTDAITRLQRRLDNGDAALKFDPKWGYLPSVLEALDVPVSSQGLVFSKTSLQVDRIGPWAPRALYFNDDVYLGWVQGGGIVEVASVDPKLGTVFYSLAQDAESRPRFVREGSTCLICHDSASVTGGVPGLIVRSVVPDRHGYALGSLHDGSTTDGTPINARWGGWYATGSAGAPHLGNAFAPVLSHEVGNVRQYVSNTPLKPAAGIDSLQGRFDTEPYLSGHSDMVALLVLTHQAQVHNLITAAGYEARVALFEEGARGSDPASRQNTLRRVKSATEPLVRAMLFADEVALAGPVRGTSSFAADFEARGPRDTRGRSLRELDLERRLFTYPLSYLIYSESFDALPEIVKSYVYRRIEAVLSGTDDSIAHMSEDERQAIHEILQDTKPDFSTSSTDSGP
jgi:hypothetical protein